MNQTDFKTYKKLILIGASATIAGMIGFFISDSKTNFISLDEDDNDKHYWRIAPQVEN